MVKVSNYGLVHVAKLIGGVDLVYPFTQIAVGTGTGSESEEDSILNNQVAYVEATVTYEASYKTVWTGTIGPFAQAYSLTEVGIRSGDGALLMRHLWSLVRGVSAGDYIQVTLKATAGRAAT